MSYRYPAASLPGILAVLGFVLVVIWVRGGPNDRFELRIPGLDRPKVEESDADSPALTGGKLVQFDGKPSELPGLWPSFRGPRRDAIAHDARGLLTKLPDGSQPLWSVALGEGHAGAAVFGGRVFVLDYDHKNLCDAVRCFSLADGKEIWRYSYPVVVKNDHGMSRTVSAVDEKHLVTLGPRGHVACFEPETGKRLWMLDLARQFQFRIPQWHASQCPLLVGDRVILAPGGQDVLLVAVDAHTGKTVWTCPNPRGWRMTHSSIMPMEFAGRKMFVYCASGGVVGVSADDGSLLWETTDWKVGIATVPSPVCLPDGRIFCCGGYDSGAVMLRLREEGGRLVAGLEYRLACKRFGSAQHTPILLGEHLYGVREKDKQLVCLDLAGKEMWRSGPQNRFGLGPYLAADGLLYVLSDEGVLSLVEATPSRYHPLDRAKMLSGSDAWAPLALAGKRLLLRDVNQMICIEVGKP